MNHMHRILKLFILFVPVGLVKLITLLRSKERRQIFCRYPKIRRLLKNNQRLNGSFQGKRCFIIGNGPSLARQDLSKLKNEICFTMNRGFSHSFYQAIKPKFHILAPIEYSVINADQASERIQVMDSGLHPDASVFLSVADESLVHERSLLAKRDKYFIYLDGDWKTLQASLAKPDLSQKNPRPQSVPIFTLLVALGLGFREIVLLGLEHNSFVTMRREYPFSNQWVGPYSGLNKDFDITLPMTELLEQNARSFRQFQILGEVAKKSGVRILNATPDTCLDQFERVSLEQILA